MKCKSSKELYDAEWFHQLMWEASGSKQKAQRKDNSDRHQLAVKMAKVMEIRLRGESA